MEDTIRIWHQSFTVLEDLPAYRDLLGRHAQKIARPSTVVDFHGMRPGTYPSDYPGDHIRYAYLQRRHTQQFIDAGLTAQEAGYDAFLIATIPDVGLEDLRTLLDIPVVALGHASLLVAGAVAAPVGIVHFIPALQSQLRRNASHHGLAELLGPIIGIDARFHDVKSAYVDPSPLIAAFEIAARRAIEQGARVIIPGEVPLNLVLAANGVAQVDGVPVLDSFAAALKLCEARVELARATGLGPNRSGGLYYDRPPMDLVKAVHRFYGDA